MEIEKKNEQAITTKEGPVFDFKTFLYKLFSVFMWHNHIPKLNITFPSEVLALSDKRPYRNLTFHNVLARQGSS